MMTPLALSILAVSTLGTAHAADLVIVDHADRKQDIADAVPADATFMTWGELRGLPLAWEGAGSVERCLTARTSVADVEAHLGRAESALAYMENANVIGHVRQLHSAATCAEGPVPAATLARAAYLTGLAHHGEGDTDKAKEAWRRTFVIDPDMQWDDNFEPSGKPLFEETRKQLGYEPSARLVMFPSKATLQLNGSLVESGATLHSGAHLVQHPAKDHDGYRLKGQTGVDVVAVSFPDFDPFLELVMNDQTARQELLRGVRILQPDTNLMVVASNQLWSLAMGGERWTSKSLGPEPAPTAQKNADKKARRQEEQPDDEPAAVAQPTPPPPEPKPSKEPVATASPRSAPSASTARPMRIAGASAVALGAAALGWSFIEHQRFDDYPNSTPLDTAQATLTRQRTLWFTGVGLGVVGAGLVVGGSF